MTRHRKVLLASLALLAALGVLALPGVHWRLIGWARGEPFWHRRPASYWRGRVASALVVGTSLGAADEVIFYTGGTLAEAWRSATLAAGLVVAAPWETYVDPREVRPDAVPVLRSLLADPDPKVRAFAVEGLGHAGPAARTALPALQELRHDTTTVLPWLTVGDLQGHPPDRHRLGVIKAVTERRTGQMAATASGKGTGGGRTSRRSRKTRWNGSGS